MRIFVAATADEWLTTQVLEFSLRDTTALPVEVRLTESSAAPFSDRNTSATSRARPFRSSAS